MKHRARVVVSSAAVAASMLLAHCSTSGGSGSQTNDGGGGATADGGTNATSDSGADRSDAPRSKDSSVPANDSGTDARAPSGPTLAGCPLFPLQSPYNEDISTAAIDPASPTYLAALQANAPVIGLDYPGGEIYNIVPASQAPVPVQTASWCGFDSHDQWFFDADASAAVAPIPSGVQYENMGVANQDHHMMVLQEGSCQLFELYAWNPTGAMAGWSVLIQWDLNGDNEQIPDSLEIGSTTAAGTPLLPGVIWPDEVAAGEIRHAIDIVMPVNAISKCTYVHPASDGAWTATGAFPYGGRFRLKASYDISKITGTQALVVLRALQTYGMFNTDISGETRSSFRLGGLGSNQGWDQADITQLANLTWDDFDVVDLGTIQTMKGCQ